ncbi:MAG: tripartite tricarboxylate transporter substrate-binding protein [Gemmatimonadota bacterium]
MSHEPPDRVSPDPSRRRLLRWLGAAAGGALLSSRPLAGIGSERVCESLRGRRVSWLVGWSPGGGYDIYSRLLEAPLERALDAEIVIENMPGASGIVAARRISTSRPDGRTLGILNGTGLMLAPYSNPGFAPSLEHDFTLLGRIVDHEQALVVGRASGITSLSDLVEIGRRRPIVLGVTGPTTVNVLLSAALEDLFGIEVALVLGFPGSQELLTAVLRGDLDGAVIGDESAEPLDELLPLLRFSHPPLGGPAAERGRTLLGEEGVLATDPQLFPDPERAQRDAADLATLMDVGRLVAAPPGLPAELGACMAASVASALADPALLTRAAQAGRTLRPGSAAETARTVSVARLALPRFAAAVERAVRRATG